jgi:SAM-dependent methyltransferase
MNISEYNEKAWDSEVEKGNKWTIPISANEISTAKTEGRANILLTPNKFVPPDWYSNNIKGKKILCLAGGGGQQGPLFAALGSDVTVFDNSLKQLQQDAYVAKRDSLEIKCEHGNMKDLSRFENNCFDLIFNPISNCYVNEIQSVWKECFRVLKGRGTLIVGFTNPIVYIFDQDKWDKGIFELNHKIPYTDLEQLSKDQLQKRIQQKRALEFGHSLEAQIGGLIQVGFFINGFYEDISDGDILDEYISSFIAIKGFKP